LVTDLRNHLYEATMRRSSSFFHKHATGTILSTLINDVDRVQTAVSAVLGEFLQQLFTFLATVALVIALGGRLSWALLLFVPVVITSSRRIGRSVRTRTRSGQDKLAEIQNILHETVTGNRIVKAFNTELWEILRFKKAASRLFRANLRSVRIQSISSPLMDTIGSVAIALLLWIGRNEIQHGRMTAGCSSPSSLLLFKLYDPVRKFASSTTAFSRPWALRPRSSASSIPRTTCASGLMRPTWRAFTIRFDSRTWVFPIRPRKASTRFCTTSISRCAPVKCWRWSDRAARASPHW
jgi:subfamily B ATP-binding cassette protein MsbA